MFFFFDQLRYKPVSDQTFVETARNLEASRKRYLWIVLNFIDRRRNYFETNEREKTRLLEGKRIISYAVHLMFGINNKVQSAFFVLYDKKKKPRKLFDFNVRIATRNI